MVQVFHRLYPMRRSTTTAAATITNKNTANVRPAVYSMKSSTGSLLLFQEDLRSLFVYAAYTCTFRSKTPLVSTSRHDSFVYVVTVILFY